MTILCLCSTVRSIHSTMRNGKAVENCVLLQYCCILKYRLEFIVHIWEEIWQENKLNGKTIKKICRSRKTAAIDHIASFVWRETSFFSVLFLFSSLHLYIGIFTQSVFFFPMRRERDEYWNSVQKATSRARPSKTFVKPLTRIIIGICTMKWYSKTSFILQNKKTEKKKKSRPNIFTKSPITEFSSND